MDEERARLAALTVFRDVVGVPDMQPEDDFFALGGDSAKAVEIAMALSDELDCEISPNAILLHPSASMLAQEIARHAC